MLTSFRLFNKPMMQRRLTMSTATTFLDQSNAVKPNAVDKEFQKNMKLGVLFLNLGGPETLKVNIASQHLHVEPTALLTTLYLTTDVPGCGGILV
jgi:hypothetical protein